MLTSPCLILAHRGESFDAPENTAAAFDLAWRRGCEAIELDVHVTADGQVVVCHDFDTLRIAGVKHVIRESTLAALEALDVGSWKLPQFAGERLTTLDAVLDRVPEGKHVFVEIKPGVEAVEPVAAVLDRYAGVDVTVIAFDMDVVREIKQRLPGRRAWWLISPKRDQVTGQWSITAPEILRRARDVGADGIGINHRFDVSATLVDAAHAGGMCVNAWTIDDPARARQLIAAGVDVITSNRAAWLREELE